MTENKVKKAFITGGTGFLGQALAKHLLSLGWHVIVVSRHRPEPGYYGTWVQWDGQTVGHWVRELDGADAVINLAGRSVDCRKTMERCDEIFRSRIDSVLAIGEALKQCHKPPGVWVQASTAHIYGDPPDTVCAENTPIGLGLAPMVGERWEAALDQACPDGIRTVLLRTSFVLGREGGALPVLHRLARFGLGGRIGSGRQWVSWLHIDDMVAVMKRAICEPTMQGVYNVTAPEASTNAEFMRAMRKAIGMPVGLPSPGWLVRIGGFLLIDTDPELPLYGRNVVPTRLLQEGFTFQHPDLDEALRNLLGRPVRQPMDEPAAKVSTKAA